MRAEGRGRGSARRAQRGGRLAARAALGVFFAGFEIFLAAPPAAADGTISGQGRFEKVKGKPAAGYAHLYESNLFASRTGGGVVGPSRRLGAPPGQAPRYDGYYAVTVPAGTYSILVSQPLFFIRPKVLPDLVVEDGRTLLRNVELPIDFSTYFTDTWALPFSDVWYQTFVATGTSITGISWKLAGTNATRIRASVHEDDGSASPAAWPQVSAAAAKEKDSGVLADNWVRWRSGQVPTEPGKRYAVKLTGVQGGDRKFSPFNRAKGASSYSGGQAYDGAGRPLDCDLNVTVFSDNDGTAIILAKTTDGLGELRDGYFDTRWGQTFRARMGTSLAAADVWAAGANSDWDLDFTWTVRKGGPSGSQVGPTKTTKAAYQAFGAGLHGVSYGPGEVPLEAGELYYIEFTNPKGFNPYVMEQAADAYADGAAYQAGALKDGGSVDLSMTIIVYVANGGSVSGEVKDAASGAPLGGAEVAIPSLGRKVRTDASGRYRLPEIPPGTHTVQATMPGYATGSRTGVEVAEGEETRVDFALERTACTRQFRNGGFESALDGWTRYGAAKTSNPTAGWFGGMGPKEGSRFWGNEVNGLALGTGGVYQSFCVEPGRRIRAAAWSNIYWILGGPNDARSRIGLHPAGGTDVDSSVVWSAWDVQPRDKTEAWRPMEVVARATALMVTVFLDFEQRDASGQLGGQWRINAFDAVEIEDLDAAVAFERGDCRNDGRLNISDPIFLLEHLFQGGGEPTCLSACDGNDDGSVDLSDAVSVLQYLFLGGSPVPPPSGACGPDPTPDGLSCEGFEC